MSKITDLIAEINKVAEDGSANRGEVLAFIHANALRSGYCPPVEMDAARDEITRLRAIINRAGALALQRASHDMIRETLAEGATQRRPTDDEIYRAALAWCGEKDRETFNSDIDCFRQNWSSSPGLRSYVEKQMGRDDG